MCVPVFMCVPVCMQYVYMFMCMHIWRPEDGIRDLTVTLHPIPLRLSLTEPETRLAVSKPQRSLIPTVLGAMGKATPDILHEDGT